jgi:hypothetical protein
MSYCELLTTKVAQEHTASMLRVSATQIWKLRVVYKTAGMSRPAVGKRKGRPLSGCCLEKRPLCSVHLSFLAYGEGCSSCHEMFSRRTVGPGPIPLHVSSSLGCLTLDDDVSTGVSRKLNSPGRPPAPLSNISPSTSRIAFRLIFITSDVYINGR